MLRLRSIYAMSLAALAGCAAPQPKAPLPPFADVPPPPPLWIDSAVIKRTDVEKEQPVIELSPGDLEREESSAPSQPPAPEPTEPPHTR
jgi:hypothetical protein